MYESKKYNGNNDLIKYGLRYAHSYSLKNHFCVLLQ